MFKSDLDKDIGKEESGPLGRIYRSLVNAGRSTSKNVDLDLAKKEAQELYDVIYTDYINLNCLSKNV